MGKNNKKPKEPQEKVITGSGAEVGTRQQAAEHLDGNVKCKCVVPCVWRGYRDEGDTVWIEREMIEKDDFIRMHFKALDGDELFKNSVKGPQGDPKGAPGSDNADGADGNSDGADGNGEGQGELGLK